MKNKKGFTLVELLAVIAILAILVILVLPNVLKQFNNAKKDAFIVETETVYDEVATVYIENELKGGTKKTTYSSDTNDLDLGGDVNYCIFTDTNGNINYMQVSNNSFYITYDGTKNINKYTREDVKEITDDVVTDCGELANKINSGEIKTHKICHFTGELTQGTTYTDEYYEYRYKQINNINPYNNSFSWINSTNDGWGVRIKDDIIDTITSISTSPCTILTNGEENESVVSVVGLYGGAKNLAYIDVSGFNTINITDMSKMFSTVGSNLTDSFEIVGLDNWDTRNVTNMSGLFWKTASAASSWNIGDLSKWNTSKVTNMSDIFASACQNANSCDLGNLNTKQVTLYGSYTYTAWDVSNVTDMMSMFLEFGEKNAGKEDGTVWNIGEISNWNTSSVKNMHGIFAYVAINAQSFDIGDLSTKIVTVNGKTYTAWDVSSVTNMMTMFYYSGTNVKDKWNIGNISNWDTSGVTYADGMNNMFGGIASSSTNVSVDLGDLSTKTVTVGSKTYTAWDVSNVKSMEGMFMYSCIYCNSFNIGDISNWDTSKVTDMEKMFRYIGKNSKNLNLSSWNIANVTNHDDFSTDSKTTITEPNW